MRNIGRSSRVGGQQANNGTAADAPISGSFIIKVLCAAADVGR